MSKIKKLILGLSVAITMAIAFVVGFVGLQPNKVVSNGVSKEVSSEETSQSKPTTYTYAPNQVQVVKGGDTLNFEYQPDGLTTDGAVKAYEYVFGSNRDEQMAVNLKYINTTDVEVSYKYSTTPLDTTQTITGETDFTLQTLENNGDEIYIYILVSPTNENIPATFTQEIVWWFGKLGTMTITNPVTNQTISKPVVKGQPVDEELIKSLFVTTDGEYMGEIFYDGGGTQLAPTQVQNRPLYVEVANLPSDWLILDGEHYVVTKGTSTLPSQLVIPSYYNGKPVTHIADGNLYTWEDEGDWSSMVFAYQSHLTSVKLPSTMQYIGEGAFLGCSGLTSITLPRGLTSMGKGVFIQSGLTSIDLSLSTKLTNISERAFEECGGLTSITIPHGITSIGSSAFVRCGGLTRVVINAGITNVGIGAFASCYNLNSIVVETGNKVYDSRNNCNAIIETSTNTLVTGCKNTIIPNSITSIGESAFDGCSGLTSVTLPRGLTTICNNAFDDCSGLTGDLVIPNGVTSMGESAFSKCSGLTSIDMSECSGLTSIANWTFYQCTGLIGDLVIPSGVTSIGSQAFYGCGGLTGDLVIPSGVTWVDGMAFYNCSGLTSIDLGACNGLTTIDIMTFFGCSALTSVTLPRNLTTIGLEVFKGCGELTDINLPSSLTTIGAKAFHQCFKLSSIVIPANVTKIGKSAFESCTKLNSITFEDTSTWYRTTSSSYTGGTMTSVTNTTQNATYFKSTYYNYYWYKV